MAHVRKDTWVPPMLYGKHLRKFCKAMLARIERRFAKKQIKDELNQD